MQKTNITATLALLFCTNLIVSASAGADLVVTNNLRIVAEHTSRSSDFEAALKSLANAKTDQDFWVQRAADPMLDPNRRRKCVRYLFEHMNVRGLTLGKLLQSLNAPVSWISAENIHKLPPILAGQFPTNLFNPQIRRIFWVTILTEQRGDFRLGFYWGLAGDPSESELQQAFRSGTATNSIRDIAVITFAKDDTDDVEANYPGQAWRLINW